MSVKEIPVRKISVKTKVSRAVEPRCHRGQTMLEYLWICAVLVLALVVPWAGIRRRRSSFSMRSYIGSASFFGGWR